MRKLITGGAGFIGSNYLRKYVPEEKDIEFVVVDALTYAGKLDNLIELLDLPNFSFHHGDIADKQFMQKLIKQGDTLINFAAESHVDRSINSGYEFVKTNVLGTQVLLDLSVKAGDINFIQISTDEVYGSLPKGSSKETDSILPNSPYSSSKASADLLCRAYFKTYGLNVKITRCTNNYGPFQFPEKIIPLFVLNLIHGRKLPIYGDGQYSRDWIHVDDHCDGIHKVLKMGASGEIYNIGASNELSNLELTSLILNQFGQDNSMIEFVNDRKGHDYRYSLNWKKISTECGFKPKIDFTSGLADTIKWYQNNSKFWSTRV